MDKLIHHIPDNHSDPEAQSGFIPQQVFKDVRCWWRALARVESKLFNSLFNWFYYAESERCLSSAEETSELPE